jgi:hypothetical protein
MVKGPAMKVAPIALVAGLTLLGCSSETGRSIPPTTPSSSASSAHIWGFVVDPGGACVVGATVEVISGPGLGRRSTQTEPCSAWDWEAGFVLSNLSLGAAVTLRASASGWSSQEKTLVPAPGAYAQPGTTVPPPVLFELFRIQ